MKTKNRIIIYISIFAIFFSIQFSSALAYENDSIETNTIITDKKVKPGALTSEETAQINEDLAKANTIKTDREIIQDKADGLIFKYTARSKESSNQYAGHYVGDDNIVYLRWVVDNNKKDNIKKSLALNDLNVVIIPSQYSLNELNSLVDNIDAFFLNQSPPPYGIQSYYLDVLNNKVVVSIAEPFEKNMLEFKTNIIYSDAIEFRVYEDLNQDSSYSNVISRQPGGWISPAALVSTTHSNGRKQAGAAGIYAYKNSTRARGFVASAHVGRADLNPRGTEYGLSGQAGAGVIGTLENAQFSGTVDAAFVKLGSTWDMDNNGYYSGIKTDVKYNDGVEMTGSMSWKVAGTVLSTSGRTYVNDGSGSGATLTDLIVYKRDSGTTTQAGDSGSVVACNGKLIGTHVGSDTRDSYLVKIANIQNALGVTAY